MALNKMSRHDNCVADLVQIRAIKLPHNPRNVASNGEFSILNELSTLIGLTNHAISDVENSLRGGDRAGIQTAYQSDPARSSKSSMIHVKAAGDQGDADPGLQGVARGDDSVIPRLTLPATKGFFLSKILHAYMGLLRRTWVTSTGQICPVSLGAQIG